MREAERFWSKARKTSKCWLWTSVRKGKYGWFASRGKTWSAHRFAWMLIHGNIPRGKVIAHSCDNGLCVRPAHLWIGTQGDNLRDMWMKKRHRNNLAKLTEEDVISIRMSARVKTIKGLARTFRVIPKTIRNVLSGHTWRNTSERSR